MLIELYINDGATSTCIRLGGTSWPVSHLNGPGSQMDESNGQADAPNALNGAGTTQLGHGDNVGTYLVNGGVRCGVDRTGGVRSHMDASIGHGDVPSVETNTLMPTNVLRNVRTCRKKSQTYLVCCKMDSK